MPHHNYHGGKENVNVPSLTFEDKPWEGGLVRRRRDRAEQEYTNLKRMLQDRNTPGDVYELGQILLKIAKDPETEVYGRIAAIKLYLEHTVGKPRVAPEDKPDTDPALGSDTIMAVVMTALKDHPELRVHISEQLERVGQ